ncbi:MAG: MerR family transcriptional regulator [Oscillospiraceae bacterium]|jgi:DNA-binding transcriptional MerR regulator|nr:MerR family transcriptional regulator [Oscillospiraceae bacterium]
MEYSISKLAKLAGVSTRTLRYYDQAGLLRPERIEGNGYRVYGQSEVDLLQQILFYREMDVPLGQIKRIVLSQNFDGRAALADHLATLLAKKERLNRLIETVEKSISALKGETTMADQEKFEGFKQKLIDDNEKLYGAEIREKYGHEEVDSANAKVKGMSREQYERAETLRKDCEETLKAAFLAGDPASETAQRACEQHKQWLCCFYDKYSKQYHRGLAQMYVDDPRFAEYYDKIAVGCAAFLREAIFIYASDAV